MKDEIMDFVLDQFGIAKDTTFEFRKLCGFTFVFQKSIFTYGNDCSSAEMKPVGIIYEENGEYYLAPLDEVNEIDAIVKEFAEIYLKYKN